MDNVINVRIRNLYGNTLYYPICDIAAIFADIAKTETLTLQTLEKIKKLGFVVMVEYTPNLCKSL